jgi:two-component system cell cycle sensor histidine kinase/response regulator CckA
LVDSFELKRELSETRFVIKDLNMPHIDGDEFFREFCRVKPHVKVIMYIGYNEKDVTQKFVGKGFAGFTQ